MIASEHRRQKIQSDPRGKIKTGEKGLSASGKEIPKSLDHFNVEAFPEIIALYGNEPKELMIAVPSDNIPDVYDDRFALYGNQTKLRSCDGDTCIHRINETVCGQSYVAGEESDCLCLAHGLFDTEDKELKKKACRYTMNLKAFVLNPHDGKLISTLPYLFETGSKNSGGAVYSALANLAGLTTLIIGQPKLAFLPMKLWVKMVGGKEDAKMKFPIWECTPMTSIAEIIERLRGVGRALGWDADLMKRIDKSLLLTEGTPIPPDVTQRISDAIKRATRREELVALGRQILEIEEEKRESLQAECKQRWSVLGFDKKEPVKTDTDNPLGLE